LEKESLEKKSLENERLETDGELSLRWQSEGAVCKWK